MQVFFTLQVCLGQKQDWKEMGTEKDQFCDVIKSGYEEFNGHSSF